MSGGPTRILTVDVEDWFHIIDSPGAPAPASWDDQPSRVVQNTEVLLDLLARHDVRATFFVLGWVARQHPGLVPRIAGEGHEIASHGWSHTPLTRLREEQFRSEIRDSKALLEDQAGQPVLGYRAPGFSMTDETSWAFRALGEAGYRYDASVVLGYHAHGGRSELPELPELQLLPMPTVGLGRLRLPFSGGGYLRLLPLPMVERLARIHGAADAPVVYYVHPREIDPRQPRMPIPARRWFKHYVRLRGFRHKLDRLIAAHHFETARGYLGLGDVPAVHGANDG